MLSNFDHYAHWPYSGVYQSGIEPRIIMTPNSQTNALTTGLGSPDLDHCKQSEKKINKQNKIRTLTNWNENNLSL